MTFRNPIIPVHAPNLSIAWATAFARCWHAPHTVLAPQIVSFTVDEDDPSWHLESPNIRQKLEEQLLSLRICSANQSNIDTVASTIFPQSIWIRCQGDRHTLFAEYEKIWPLIGKCSRNRRGTYFRRLTAYGGTHDTEKINQLDLILEKWMSGNHCHSVLQASIFDPFQDHINSRIPGFPCLQQIAFHPHGPNGSMGMSVVAFYANQLLLEKAYGNYLGLYYLGRFMASEMNLALRQITCITSNLKLSDRAAIKNRCRDLYTELNTELSSAI